MSIDEAIQKARYVADEHSDCWRNCENLEKCCKECEYEHEQLAEWLEELKELREISKKNPFLVDMIKHDKIVRNKAIDDFLEKIQWEYLNGCGIKQSEIEFLVDVSYQVAEQLKAGGNIELPEHSKSQGNRTGK